MALGSAHAGMAATNGTGAVNASMLAVVWNGHPYNMSVETRPRPTIHNATDAIVRISTAAICGTDLHVYHGLYGSSEPGWVMGHEGVGYIESVGDGVHAHQVGDYVVVPDNFGTGQYPNVNTFTDSTPGYGVDLTDGQVVGGAQAEYVRVPWADYTLQPIPKSSDGTWNTSKELDYVMTSDIFATAWQGLTWSGFEAGDSVAVFGAGPVGQMAAYSAVLRGASRVYIIDRIQSRLALAETIGAIPINYSNGSAVQQILSREPQGVDRAVEAVGMEARAANGSLDVYLAVEQAFQVTRNNGGIGAVGVYDVLNDAPGRPRASTIPTTFPFDLSTAFSKSLLFHIGSVDVRQIARQLLELITSGKANPGYIVSSQINITQAPQYYQRFGNWLESKVVIRF